MKVSRRKFLGTLGAGAVVSGSSSLLPLRRAYANHQSRPSSRPSVRSDRFGRMFPNLDPFFKRVGPTSPKLRAALLELGKHKGILDAGDVLGDNGEQAAINLIGNPGNNPDNVAPHTAGTTFVGQFLDHDATFDQTSQLGIVTEPGESPNTRDPRFELDSVYGDGPLGSPELYQRPRSSRERPTKLRIESGGLFEDVPRNSDNSAIIADPRNDENMMISGLQAAVILFHNHAVDVIKDDNPRIDSDDLFEKARQLTTWHYQWLIVHEFLPLFIGQALTNDIFRNGRKFFRPEKAFIPVEWQGACYRFGHSMVRPSYRANLGGDVDNPGSPAGTQFFGMIFVPDTDPRVHTNDPIDLRGGARAKRRFIGWQTFFDFGPTFTDPGNPASPALRRNKLIDAKISTPLFLLPVQTIAGAPPNEEIISLPQRNLLRHITWSQPSGQDIADFIRVDKLSPDETGLNQKPFNEVGLERDTPLWYYALKEAELMAGGRTLGPVGGRVVGEVFAALLQLDQNSYLNARDRWKPTLPQRNGRVTGDFKMVDFLTFAGVAPDQRGQ